MNKLLPNPCCMSGFLNSGPGELSFDLNQLIKDSYSQFSYSYRTNTFSLIETGMFSGHSRLLSVFYASFCALLSIISVINILSLWLQFINVA